MTGQKSNIATSIAVNSNPPIGVMLHEIGAQTKHWVGGVCISVQVDEKVRDFHYDFAESAWYEQLAFGQSKPMSARDVRGIVEQIFCALQ